MPENKGPKPEWQIFLPPEEEQGTHAFLNNWLRHLLVQSPHCIGGPCRLTAGPFGGPTMRKRDIAVAQKVNGAIWETWNNEWSIYFVRPHELCTLQDFLPKFESHPLVWIGCETETKPLGWAHIPDQLRLSHQTELLCLAGLQRS